MSESAAPELHGGGPCALCGRDPSAGFASIGDEWYCHGDDDPEPTCYMRATWDEANRDKNGAAVGRRGHAPF